MSSYARNNAASFIAGIRGERMIRRTIVLGLLSFAFSKFSYAEITEVELSDGTIVKRTTTQISNAGHPNGSKDENRQEDSDNYSLRNRIEPIIFINPRPPKPGSPPRSGDASHDGKYNHNPAPAPYMDFLPDKNNTPEP
jgi:hypothetical protein